MSSKETPSSLRHRVSEEGEIFEKVGRPLGKCVKPEKGVEEGKEEGEVGVNATSPGETEAEAEAEKEAAMTDTAPLSLSFTWLTSKALPQHLLQ